MWWVLALGMSIDTIWSWSGGFDRSVSIGGVCVVHAAVVSSAPMHNVVQQAAQQKKLVQRSSTSSSSRSMSMEDYDKPLRHGRALSVESSGAQQQPSITVQATPTARATDN